MTKICLIGDYDYSSQQALKKVVNNIQIQYDINPKIIQNWLDRDDFSEMLLKHDRYCYRKVMSQSNEILEKLIDITYTETYVNEYLFWEKEKCGQIIDEHSNGYIQYCNKHKYLHNDKKSLTKKRSDANIDHSFLSKNSNEIMEEQIFKIRFNIYLKYNRLLANILENDFFSFLIDHHKYKVIYIQQEDGLQIVEWLKSHPFSFRSKFPVYSENEEIHIKLYISENDTDFPNLKIISSNML